MTPRSHEPPDRDRRASLRERLGSVRYVVDESALGAVRRRDLLTLGLWLLPPWIVVGYLVYLITGGDLTLARLGLVAVAYPLVRLLSRLMALSVLHGIGVIRRAPSDRKGT